MGLFLKIVAVILNNRLEYLTKILLFHLEPMFGLKDRLKHKKYVDLDQMLIIPLLTDS